MTTRPLPPGDPGLPPKRGNGVHPEHHALLEFCPGAGRSPEDEEAAGPEPSLVGPPRSSPLGRALLLAGVTSVLWYALALLLFLAVAGYFALCSEFNVLAPGAAWLANPWLLVGLSGVALAVVAWSFRRQPKEALAVAALFLLFAVLPLPLYLLLLH